MEPKYKVGQVVYHQSDSERSTPMVVTEIKLREPATWENPITGETNRDQFDPYFEIHCEWLCAQKVIRSHKFRESDFQDITV